jgi:hypothetical protein
MGAEVCNTDLLSAGPFKVLQVDAPAAKTQLRFLRENFVITYMDKAPNNFLAICKKVYIQACMADLTTVPTPASSASFLCAASNNRAVCGKAKAHCIRVAGTAAGTPSASCTQGSFATNATTGATDADATAAAPAQGLPQYPEGTKLHGRLLTTVTAAPYIAAISKQHKIPPALRFLACSSNIHLTPAVLWLNAFFRALMPHVNNMWGKAVDKINHTVHATRTWYPQPWLCTNSVQAAAAAQHFNSHGLPADADCPRHGYVQFAPDPKAEHFYKFTEASVRSMLELVINNAIIMFGADTYYHQVLGIPMGINPAVFIANLYLFWYEYRFLIWLPILSSPWLASEYSEYELFPYNQLPADSVLLDPANSPLAQANQGVLPTTTRDVLRVVLGCFAFTKRFVDDLFTAGNPLFTHLTYNSQSIGPIPGIYPPALSLKPSAQVSAGSPVPFLVFLGSIAAAGTCGWLLVHGGSVV